MRSRDPFWSYLHSKALLLLFLVAATRCAAQETPSPSLEAQVAPGIEALKSGDLDSAEKVFSSALRQGVKHPLVYHNLGVIAQMRGRHLEAVQKFREALALQPAYGPSRLLLGSSLLVLGRKAEAVRELQRAVRLMPQQPQAHLQLANAYQEKYELTLEAFQRAADADPKLPEVHLAIGSILLEQKKYEQALAEIALELKLVPESKGAAELKAKIEEAKAHSLP